MDVSTNLNNVRVYNVNSSGERPMKKGKRDSNSSKTNIDLLQGMRFPTIANGSKFSPNGEYMLAYGTYPPVLKMYDLRQNTIKFERRCDSEIVEGHFLSEDYRKLALILSDRYIEFHVAGGKHYRLRVPKTPLCSTIDTHTPELQIGGVSGEVWRLDLAEGRFRNSVPLFDERSDDNLVTCMVYNPDFALTMCGTSSGKLFALDSRVKRPVAELDVAAATTHSLAASGSTAPTALAVDPAAKGFRVAVGLGTGEALLYDLRASLPQVVLDHYSDSAICKIEFHSAGGVNDDAFDDRKVITADHRSVRVWDLDASLSATKSKTTNNNKGGNSAGDDKKLFCVVEPPASINSFTVCPGSGLMLVATKNTAISAYYIPQLAPAPKWCAFLDSITEELDEHASVQGRFEGLRFVTRDELIRLGLGAIATNPAIAKPYMHGFYISRAMYEKALLASRGSTAEEKLKSQSYKEWAREEENRKLQNARITRLRRVGQSSAADELIDEAGIDGDNEAKKVDDRLDFAEFGDLVDQKEVQESLRQAKQVKSQFDPADLDEESEDDDGFIRRKATKKITKREVDNIERLFE